MRDFAIPVFIYNNGMSHRRSDAPPSVVVSIGVPAFVDDALAAAEKVLAEATKDPALRKRINERLPYIAFGSGIKRVRPSTPGSRRGRVDDIR
jgi:hypothetical protein